MISVVVLEPENEGNIGAIARVMANFDQKNLVLIDPKCNHLSQESRNRAKHAQSILKNAKIKDKKYLKTFDYVIGTTAKLGTDYNIPRSPVSAAGLGESVKGKRSKIALLIGREGPGLSNKEILDCDFVVTIPASRRYPTMNVSHSLAILLYEIFQKSKSKKSNDQFVPASLKDKEIILQRINSLLEKLDFATKEKKETQKKVWKRILGKAFLTRREAFALLGFFKKIKK